MRKNFQKFSKDDSRLNDYSSFNLKHSNKNILELVQIPVFMSEDDEEYYFEVVDY